MFCYFSLCAYWSCLDARAERLELTNLSQSHTHTGKLFLRFAFLPSLSKPSFKLTSDTPRTGADCFVALLDPTVPESLTTEGVALARNEEGEGVTIERVREGRSWEECVAGMFCECSGPRVERPRRGRKLRDRERELLLTLMIPSSTSQMSR